jgi:TetR/AcrR family transcriptional regulator
MDNRQVLLNRALELFSQRGYDAVGVREVVEAAGVTKPTLYHYFGSKRGLLDALLKREAGCLLAQVVQASAYQGDLVLTLESITRAYFYIAKRFSAFYRMQLTLYFSPPESEANRAIRPFSHEQHLILEGVFIQAAEDHSNMRGRHRRYAAGFLGAINAMIDLFLNDQLELTDEVIYQTVRQFMHGIFS